MSMEWWRCKHGAPFDPKWRVVAGRAGSDVRPGDVWAVFTTLCDRASQASDRGSLDGLDLEDVAAGLGYDAEQVSRIVTALKAKSLIDDERITTWVKHQPKREDEGATERKREQRAREKEAQKSATKPVSHAMSRDVTESHSREEKTREDTELDKKQNPVASATSEPQPFPSDLDLTLAFEHWDETAEDLGLAKVRDRSSDRRQKLKQRLKDVGSLAQWCLLLNSLKDRPFCLGEGPRNGQAPWKVDIDYVLSKAGFRKLLEGAWLKDGAKMIEAEFHASH